jgi:cyclic-di-GMP phosphodiesterase, flagellum assembly factor TipF
MRLGAFFVAFCIAVIAASAGAAAYFGLGLNGTDSVIVAVVVLTALTLYNTLSTRLSVRSIVGPQLTELTRASGELARQIAELGRRLVAVEARLETTLARGEDPTEPLVLEISELGTLVNQLAETVALHEALLKETEHARAEPRPRPAPAQPAAANRPPAPPVIAPAAPPALPVKTAPAQDNGAEQEMLATIRGAVEANRIDLYLQPIVTLPQRKVRYYEAMSRLRTATGEVLLAEELIPRAEAGGLIPRIDNQVVFRCVQVLRRLLLKDREVGVFCNLSAATLTDSRIFPQLLDFLDANRAIAPSLVLELAQAGLRGAGPIENESLAALNERGFRFSLDNVTDLRIEPRELASRGFRFVKLPASLLLNRAGRAADVHPADFPNRLGRFGIDLIAEKIDSEGAVVDLLDRDVKFGQGLLFSPPRPVRAEALPGIAERNDMVARETRPATEPAGAAIAAAVGPAEARAPAQLARRM